MTEVELVATAFATGAAAGLTGSAHGVVHDLYAGLREAVRRRLVEAGGQGGGGGKGAGGGYGLRVLDAYETDPDVWRTRLLQVLTGSGVETDEEILAAARAVLRTERPRGHIGVDICGKAQHNGSAAVAWTGRCAVSGAWHDPRHDE